MLGSISEEKLREFENDLKEANAIDADDSIEKYVSGDCWSFMAQTRGNWFFTSKKLVFLGGFMTLETVAYSSITEVKKCNVGGLIPVMPTGIKISYTNEKGKTSKLKMSVMKRTAWLEELQKRANL